MRQLERKKLFEAIGFFLRNTNFPGLVKLFKLLYFLDMLHFRETGRAVTGLTYAALPYGPVPLQMLNEFRQPPPDLGEAFSIQHPPAKEEEVKAPVRTVIVPRQGERDQYLSVREKRICVELAEIFLNATADDMSLVSHAKGGPWERARDRNPGKWKEIIDFHEALSPTLKMGSGKALQKELLKMRAEEFEEDYQYFK